MLSVEDGALEDDGEDGASEDGGVEAGEDITAQSKKKSLALPRELPP
jgi:hypothetical protein